jgi:hypothetical protein
MSEFEFWMLDVDLLHRDKVPVLLTSTAEADGEVCTGIGGGEAAASAALTPAHSSTLCRGVVILMSRKAQWCRSRDNEVVKRQVNGSEG